MSEQFTPGPWWIAGKATIHHGERGWIADVHWRNRDANARLIAAAPDLLRELKQLAEQAHNLMTVPDSVWDAIAKATGSPT